MFSVSIRRTGYTAISFIGFQASLSVLQEEEEAAEEDADREEEDEEDDEELEEADEGRRRYPLRDRSKAQVQPYVPGTGGGMLRRAGCASLPPCH